MVEKGVRYRDEVWTGIEYQVATNMIYENMTNEGLTLVKAIDERYNGTKHNPWNEIECGDHYARAMASWGVMMALQNYYYNGPEKIISFAPKVMENNFESFFTAANGWGNISQKRTAALQQNNISLQYGSLQLAQLQLQLTGKPSQVTLMVNKQAVKATHTINGNNIILTFPEQSMHEGDVLTAIIHY